MIKSMTGYGRSELINDRCRILVEIKSVNNRYLDLGIKMPRQMNALESKIRGLLKTYMQRGKVDVFITYENLGDAGMAVRYNSAVAAEYLQNLRQMAQDFSIQDDITVSELSRYPDVLTLAEEPADPDSLWEDLQGVLRQAAGQFLDERIREGNFLSQDLLAKLDEMSGWVSFIEERSPKLIEEHRTRLYEKVRELLEDTQIDESRIVQEVTIYADKASVDEELVRLRSHIKATRDVLTSAGDESVGRKLDFIAQEMNREANTILSKSADKDIADRAVLLKTAVEKIREQVQNIE